MHATSTDVLVRAWARVRALEKQAKASKEREASRRGDLESMVEFVRSAHHDALLWLAKTNAFLEQRLERALWKYAAAEKLRAAVALVEDVFSDKSPAGLAIKLALKEYDRVPAPPSDKPMEREGVSVDEAALEKMVSPSEEA